MGKDDPQRSAPDGATSAAASAGERSSEEPLLRCARCGHTLARARDAMDVAGAHVHDFSNPSGVSYRIACFAAAAGCAPAGARETFFSWFPGHAWQIALCAACTLHVGWSFTPDSGAAGFHGLILDRLAS